ncbi:hypothetical protein KL938_001048, partial [Ogataea parapolymorpha]
ILVCPSTSSGLDAAVLVIVTAGHGYLSFLKLRISFHDGREKNIAKEAKVGDHRLDIYNATSADKAINGSNSWRVSRGAKAVAVAEMSIFSAWLQRPLKLRQRETADTSG